MKRYIAVAFNLPTEKFFWYKFSPQPQEILEVGQRVIAPFRTKEKIGFVVEMSSQKPEGKLKEVKEIYDKFPPLNNYLFQLGRWLHSYYHCSLGQALHSVFPFSYPYQEKIHVNSARVPEKPTTNQDKEVYLVNPGSRKVELFLSWIRQTIENDQQALILVPEIFSIHILEKAMQRQGMKSVIFHSRLSPGERYRSWLKMQKEEVDVAVGTRSVVFSPFPNIGLLIIDEEESMDYKQKETPKYDVRKVAIKRGELENFPVYLASGSPSLESWCETRKKHYKLLKTQGMEKYSFFPTQKISYPSYFVVDLKKEKKKNRIFSELMQQKTEEALAKKLPVLFFVPRKGYASFLLCDDCGEVMRCLNCNTSLNFHLDTERKMICHICGFQKEAPSLCPFCQGTNIKKIGWGTQRVELELRKRFPEANVERFDLDVFKSSTNIIYQKITNKEIDIMIGTQLLMKDNIISMVSVVGFILVDVLLNVPDFRATEQIFHLLSKVRQNLSPGSSLIVQTYNPDYYALDENSEEFYSQEIKIRKALGYPPFQKWTRILFEGRIESKVKEKCEITARELAHENLDFLGPSTCPFYKTKGKYRYQIILRDDGTKTKALVKSIQKISSEVKSGSVSIGIDVDPLSTI